jgi:hypothetical protein
MFIVKLIFLKELNPKTPQIAQIPLPKIALAPFCPLEQRQVNQCLIETRPWMSINDKIVLNLSSRSITGRLFEIQKNLRPNLAQNFFEKVSGNFGWIKKEIL